MSGLIDATDEETIAILAETLGDMPDVEEWARRIALPRFAAALARRGLALVRIEHT